MKTGEKHPILHSLLAWICSAEQAHVRQNLTGNLMHVNALQGSALPWDGRVC